MNPIQQIAAAVTPAVMVSACGLIALGLINLSQVLSGRLGEIVLFYLLKLALVIATYNSDRFS